MPPETPGGPGGIDDADDLDRRDRNRIRRSREYAGHKSHKTRLCPNCRASLPYVEGVRSPPASCGECGYRFECPECRTDLNTTDDPAVCPTCDEPLADPDADPEESFTWDG